MALSVEELLAHLETQIAHHRERSSFHAGQESLHHERRTFHDAELATLTQLHETFKTTSASIAELAARDKVRPRAAEEDLAAGPRPKLSRMVSGVIEDNGPYERFGTSGIVRGVQERYGEWLRKPVRPHRVSIILRRLADRGRIHLVRPGRPHWEALYTRARPEPRTPPEDR